MDKIAREKAKDNYKTCLFCAKTNFNIHHCEGRRIKSVRWYLPNLLPLCPEHHVFGLFSAHQSPMRFQKALLDIFGKKWEDDLIGKSSCAFKGTYQDVKDYLDGKRDYYC